jgi:hypothetical protein
MPEGKAVDTNKSIEEQGNGEGQALIACGSNLLTIIVGCGVCIHQADVKWSKQGAIGAIKGVLWDVIEEGSEGWLWRRRHGHDWL